MCPLFSNAFITGQRCGPGLSRPELKQRAGSIFCLLAQRPFHQESAGPTALQRTGGDDFSMVCVCVCKGMCVHKSGSERGRLVNGLLSLDANLCADALLLKWTLAAFLAECR